MHYSIALVAQWVGRLHLQVAGKDRTGLTIDALNATVHASASLLGTRKGMCRSPSTSSLGITSPADFDIGTREGEHERT